MIAKSAFANIDGRTRCPTEDCWGDLLLIPTGATDEQGIIRYTNAAVIVRDGRVEELPLRPAKGMTYPSPYTNHAGVPARLKKVEEETVPSWLWRSVADEDALKELPEKERSIGEHSGKQEKLPRAEPGILSRDRGVHLPAWTRADRRRRAPPPASLRRRANGETTARRRIRPAAAPSRQSRTARPMRGG